MPTKFVLFGFIAAAVLVAESARAQSLPWCAIADNDGNTQCNFYTQEQCLQTLSGIGGVCVRNPAGNSQQSAPSPVPFSGNAQGLQQLQMQDPGPPPDAGLPPPPSAQQTIVIPNNLFTQAGFVVKYATTRERAAMLRSLPPDKLVTRRKDGRLYYVYADAARCNCAYVGTPEAYAAYRNWANIGPAGMGDQSSNAMQTIDSDNIGAPYIPADIGDSMNSILHPSF